MIKLLLNFIRLMTLLVLMTIVPLDSFAANCPSQNSPLLPCPSAASDFIGAEAMNGRSLWWTTIVGVFPTMLRPLRLYAAAFLIAGILPISHSQAMPQTAQNLRDAKDWRPLASAIMKSGDTFAKREMVHSLAERLVNNPELDNDLLNFLAQNKNASVVSFAQSTFDQNIAVDMSAFTKPDGSPGDGWPRWDNQKIEKALRGFLLLLRCGSSEEIEDALVAHLRDMTAVINGNANLIRNNSSAYETVWLEMIRTRQSLMLDNGPPNSYYFRHWRQQNAGRWANIRFSLGALFFFSLGMLAISSKRNALIKSGKIALAPVWLGVIISYFAFSAYLNPFNGRAIEPSQNLQLVHDRLEDLWRRHSVYRDPDYRNDHLPRALEDPAVASYLVRLFNKTVDGYELALIESLLKISDASSATEGLVPWLNSDNDLKRQTAANILRSCSSNIDCALSIVQSLQGSTVLPPPETVLPNVWQRPAHVGVIINDEAFYEGSHGAIVEKIIEENLGENPDALIIRLTNADDSEIEAAVNSHPDYQFIVHQSGGVLLPRLNDPRKIQGRYGVEWIKNLGSKRGVIFVFAVSDRGRQMNLRIHPALDNVLYISQVVPDGTKDSMAGFGMKGYLFGAAVKPAWSPMDGTSFTAPVATGKLGRLLRLNSPKAAVEKLAGATKPLPNDPYFRAGLLGNGLIPGLLLFYLVDPFKMRAASGIAEPAAFSWIGIVSTLLLLVCTTILSSVIRDSWRRIGNFRPLKSNPWRAYSA